MTFSFHSIAAMNMKEIAKEERPREKMLAKGPKALSNGELLAVLIRNGNDGHNALELARDILALCGGKLSSLFNLAPTRLCGMPGIGPCKAASLLAALELGRRFLEEEPDGDRKPLLTARGVYELMIPKMKGLGREECWMLLLNNSNYVLDTQMLSTGGLESTVMDVRLIVRTALEHNATGLILVHNHPSGNPTPSDADIRQTDRLHEALSAFNIELADHVVVADGSFFSFREGRRFSGGKKG